MKAVLEEEDGVFENVIGIDDEKNILRVCIWLCLSLCLLKYNLFTKLLPHFVHMTRTGIKCQDLKDRGVDSARCWRLYATSRKPTTT